MGRARLNTLALTGAMMSGLTPAHAVSLGEVTVESALGQPLSARIPIDLSPGEYLSAGCVSSPAVAGAELGNLPRPQLSVPETALPGSYLLRVTTARPLYEPMYELQVQVKCAGTALLVRQYVLMLDLPGARPEAGAPVATPAAVAPSAGTAPTQAAPTAPVAARPPHPRHPVVLGPQIAPGTSYRVVAGDTLSTIAARVGDRGGRGLWQMADLIFAANPDAFIAGNQDLIKLGSEISIPQTGSVAAAGAPSAAPTSPVEWPKEQIPAAQPASEPAASTSVAAEPVTPAAMPEAVAAEPLPAEPEAAVPVFKDEQLDAPAQPAPTAEVRPAARPAKGGGVPPWLAACFGLLIGAGASLVLLRDRLTEALRGVLGRETATVTREAARVARAPGTAPASRTLPPRESSMVVEESHEDEDSGDTASKAVTAQTDRVPAMAAPAPADAELDSELSSLFGDDGGWQPAEARQAASTTAEAELDLDLSDAAPDGAVDQDIAWLGDETALTPTQESAAVSSSGTDLQSLAERAGDDARISQTLKDALSLLESDYESELTASQVIDRTRLREVLDESAGEDTLARTGTDHNPRR